MKEGMNKKEKLSAKELSQLSDVSVRTLHHYDKIGLLTPKRNPENEYREYSQGDIDRLQQILFFKECGLPLKQISAVLESSGYESLSTLESQRDFLKLEKKRIEKMLKTIENTIMAEKGERKMSNKEKFDCFKSKTIEENEEKYGAEIRQSYGEKQVESANAKFMNLSEDEYNKMNKTGEEINRRLEEAVKAGELPSEKEGREIAALHKQWLSYTWPSYSPEAHMGLVDMYLSDERFTKYYDKNISGCAQFLRDAVHSMLK